jgi:protein-S-isoprenylcysteine O-methyltransferase Ste14
MARRAILSGRLRRNPMYLGAVLAFLGLAIYLSAPWLLLVLPAMVMALTKLAIEREEAYLRRRFGAAYEAYAARTRRWI